MTTDLPPQPEGTATELPEIALRILQAAIELFARKGYAGTSVREIVQEAQVTNPMLYYYFDSKEGLFTFLTELLHREYSRQVSDVVDAQLSLEQTLVAVVEVHLQSLRENPHVLEFVYNLLFGAEGSCPPHRLLENHAVITELLRSIFERAIERGEFTPHPAFDLTWIIHQLEGLMNAHMMRGIKELQNCASADDRAAWIDENAGIDTAKQLVRFFLDGAGEVQK